MGFLAVSLHIQRIGDSLFENPFTTFHRSLFYSLPFSLNKMFIHTCWNDNQREFRLLFEIFKQRAKGHNSNLLQLVTYHDDSFNKHSIPANNYASIKPIKVIQIQRSEWNEVESWKFNAKQKEMERRTVFAYIMPSCKWMAINIRIQINFKFWNR